jgi:hypothetical protein
LPKIINWLILPRSRWTKKKCFEYDPPFKAAIPNLQHSLSNIRVEGSVVKLTVQRSGTNSGHLDLRNMGIGIIPRSQKFIIFPNGNYEITIKSEKITTERDVSPKSPNRRMSGMLKSFGVSTDSLKDLCLIQDKMIDLACKKFSRNLVFSHWVFPGARETIVWKYLVRE